MSTENTDAPTDSQETSTDFLDQSIAEISGADLPEVSSSDVDFLATIDKELADAKPKEEQPKKDEKPKADAKPKEDAKPEADKDFADEPPGNASETAKLGWKELKTELKSNREQLAAKDKELADLKAKVANLAELEEKAKFADDAEKELAISRIQSTKEYKKVVTDPLNAIGEAATELAKSYEIEGDDLLDALSEPNAAKRSKALETLLAGVSEQDKFEVYQMVKDTQTILRKEAELQNRALEGKKELDSRQKAEQEAEAADRKKKYEASVDRTASSLMEKLPFKALADGETVEGIFENFKSKVLASDISSATPDVQAFSAFAGIVLPRLVKQYYSETQRADAAEQRIKELTASSPTSKPSTEKNKPATSNMDFLQAVAAEVGF